MGSPDPRAYSRNKRGIAGSLVWINFDRHALLDLFYKARGLFIADQDEIRPQFQNPDTQDTVALFNSSVVRDAGPSLSATIDQLDNMYTPSVGGWTELATPWYSDQILPFDITLAAANEYGAMAGAKIFGVEILNEGTGVSIDDLVTETQVNQLRKRSSQPGSTLCSLSKVVFHSGTEDESRFREFFTSRTASCCCSGRPLRPYETRGGALQWG